MLTIEELAVISLYTGFALVEGEDIQHMYYILEKLEGRPVYTHEMPRIQDKHKDKLRDMVREIYDRARAQSKFEKILADEAARVSDTWKNLLTDPPIPAKGPCDSCDNRKKENDI